MVTSKDASQNRDLRDSIAKIRQDIDARTLDYRYAVVEITPQSEDDLGGYIPKKVKQVSDFFKLITEARGWMDEHVADPGKKLEIKRQRLVEQKPEWMWG